MIVTIGSNKGGTGKTTTASNIAIALSYQKKDVCLVDSDFQRSASKWYQDRQDSNIEPSITLIEKYDNVATTLTTLNKKFDYVIVDVAGRNSREMITSLSVSDILIAPHQASQLDLDTLQELQDQLIRIKDLNPNLISYILHTMASTNPLVKAKEKIEFKEYLKDFTEFSLLESSCYYRKIYKDVIPIGKSVLESENDLAKKEILSVVKEVFNI
jgi:chromosome partitioning protein